MSASEDLTSVADELAALKARADLLGISYHPSIGVEKLRDKVNAAVTASAVDSHEPAIQPAEPAPESEAQFQQRMQLEAGKLVRIRVQCMNPMKKEWEGEIFTVGNSVVGTYKKYVPFNADDGWHVPHIIYEHIRDRQCQTFKTVSDGKGNKTRKGMIIKEFAVEVLPQLTKEELDELARRQAMAKSID